ncbi:MAG TPA: transposase [Verrucomicrobiae bacterium]|nr:transposase [Verrucomicrobiae bacterium]
MAGWQPVYRTAFRAEKIVADDGQHVTFSCRDNTGKNCRLKLSAEKFLHRFLQHVLPRGLQRVRHFGWLSAAAKERFARVRALLDWQPPSQLSTINPQPPRCPCCNKPVQLIGRLARPPPWQPTGSRRFWRGRNGVEPVAAADPQASVGEVDFCESRSALI